MQGTRTSPGGMGEENEWECHQKADKEQGVEGVTQRLTPRTGAVSAPVLALGTRRACREEGVRTLSGPGPVTRRPSGTLCPPSAPVVAESQLTSGLGDAASGSPGDSDASAILALLVQGRSQRSSRNQRRGGRDRLLRQRAESASLGGAWKGCLPRPFAVPYPAPGVGDVCLSPGPPRRPARHAVSNTQGRFSDRAVGLGTEAASPPPGASPHPGLGFQQVGGWSPNAARPGACPSFAAGNRPFRCS